MYRAQITNERTSVAKPNYQFEKRQRELEKKRKKAEKEQRKAAPASPGPSDRPEPPEQKP